MKTRPAFFAGPCFIIGKVVLLQSEFATGIYYSGI